jgi:hypothetical protein
LKMRKFGVVPTKLRCTVTTLSVGRSFTIATLLLRLGKADASSIEGRA